MFLRKGGTPQAITRPDSAQGEVSHRFPRLLPDGKHFVFVSRTVSARSGGQGDTGIKLKIASLDGKLIRDLMPAESNAVFVAGYLLFTRNGFLVAQKFDPDTFKLSGEPVSIANHVRSISGASWSLFDVSSNGTLIYQAGSPAEGSRLTWVDLKGKEIGPLGDTAQYGDPVRIAPDGSQVAISIFDPRVGTPDVWIYDVKRNLRTRFTTDPAADNTPVWSPDANRIAFSSTRSGHVALYVKSIGGSKPEELFYAGPGDNFANDVVAGWQVRALGAAHHGRRLGPARGSRGRRQAGQAHQHFDGLQLHFFAQRALARVRLERLGDARDLRRSLPRRRPQVADLDGRRLRPALGGQRTSTTSTNAH